MNFGQKMRLGFGTMLALAVATGGVGLYVTTQLGRELVTARQGEAKKYLLLGEINTAISDMLAMEKAVLLRGLYKDTKMIEANDRDFGSAFDRARAAARDIEPLLVTAEGRRQHRVIAQGLEDWKPLHIKMLADAEGQATAALSLHDSQILPLGKAINAAAEATLKLNQGLADTAAARSDSLVQQSWTWVISLLVISAVVGIVLLVVVNRGVQLLSIIANDIGAAAQQVASAAGQVSASSQSLAQGASEQAASVEETAASAEEVRSMTRQNSDNTRTSAELALDSESILTTANERLRTVVASMEQIASTSLRTAKITKVIEEIAFQTNILALNAAVEAARAGEHGMGFAVVADEVRTLAQRSAQAAKDTAELIEESVGTSQAGAARLNEMAAAIAEVTTASAKVRTTVEGIRAGSEEQARALEQIAAAIQRIEEVTQQSAASAEECAAASEELTSESESMAASSEKLRQLVGASRQASSPR